MTLPFSAEIASQIVAWGGLSIGIALGAVAQSTKFCTMGALADWFTYGGTSRLLMWVLAVAVAATGSLLLIDAGWLDATKTNAWSTRLLWLSNVAGGLIFGFGMVLASGCPQRNLVKAGAGNLKAWVTLLVVAVTAQMSLRGVLSEARIALFDSFGTTLNHPQDVGSTLALWIGGSPTQWRWIVVCAYLMFTGVALYRHRSSMDASNWLGGAAVGALVVGAWALTGHLGYLPEHPDTLESTRMGTYSHRPEALTFAAPIAHSLDLLTLWSDHNNVATYGVFVCLGTILGSAAMAVARKEVRVESFHDKTDLANHLVGGALMGFGGVTAMGCSIGQGISGLSLQSMGAVFAVAGIVCGAWLALRFQSWQLD